MSIGWNGQLRLTAAAIGVVSTQVARRRCRLTTTIMADSTIIKITCEDCGGFKEYYVCEGCAGSGGYDASTDCEVYDDWQDCPECEGVGYLIS